MKRDVAQLAENKYDVLIIGGGINGVFAAWDAALRGLSVALIEKVDFGHATSSASSKVIHGGIRFLQQGAIGRVRESLIERTTFMRIAPHIVHPIPFLIPTYGHFMRGKEILKIGMTVYDLIGFDRNGLDDPEKKIPGHSLLSREEVLSREPFILEDGLTGGVQYNDCQMVSSERMTLAVILSAAQVGAHVANYAEVTSFLKHGNIVTGVRIKDILSDTHYDVQANVVINCSGPWVYHVLDSLQIPLQSRMVGLSKGIHMVTRKITKSGAVALATKHKHESLINRGGRHFFMIPWRGFSLIGTTNVPYRGEPGNIKATEKDIKDFIDEINEVYPAAELKREDVYYAFAGFYPLVNKNVKTDVYQGGGKEYVLDHLKLDSIDGLLSVAGTKYTTARHLSKKAVNLAFKKLKKRPSKCFTHKTTVTGGNIEGFNDYLAQEVSKKPYNLDKEIVTELIQTYGTNYPNILKYIDENSAMQEKIIESQPTIKASIVHAVREEMALKLSDVIFRRTGLGTIGYPGDECLETCAAIMANELSWDKSRIKREIEETKNQFVIDV